MVALRVSVQARDFDIAAEVERLKQAGADVGAIVTFTGVCRDEGGRLAVLELEHYPGMAEEEIGRIAGEALERWPLAGIAVIHRYGRIAPGENIVLVATASTHRQAAFEAANFLMDYMKSNAPFWKKEQSVAAGGVWVGPRATDDAARQRWRKPTKV